MGGDSSKASSARGKGGGGEKSKVEARRRRLQQLERDGAFGTNSLSVQKFKSTHAGFEFKTVAEVLEWLDLVNAPPNVIEFVRDYQIDGEGLLVLPVEHFQHLVEKEDGGEEEKGPSFMDALTRIRKFCEVQKSSMMEAHYKDRRKDLEQSDSPEPIRRTDGDGDEDAKAPISEEEEQQKLKERKKRKKKALKRKIEVDDFFPPHQIPQGGKKEDLVLYYHEVTKHEAEAGSRSLKTDWALQPSAFRRYYGAPYTLFKEHVSREMRENDQADAFPPFEFDWLFDGCVGARGGAASLTIDSLHDFFYHSLALSAKKQALGQAWTLRVAPSRSVLPCMHAFWLMCS